MKALVGIEQKSFPVIKEVLPCRKNAHIKFSHVQACLVNRLCRAVVFSKFDMKSGFWQIQIKESDRYKTAFTTPFGHYEWNVMPFGLKNAPSEFQNIMNEIFNPFSSFAIIYIDDVLIFLESLNQHKKHLRTFLQTVKLNGLVVSAPKIKLFQTRI